MIGEAGNMGRKKVDAAQPEKNVGAETQSILCLLTMCTSRFAAIETSMDYGPLYLCNS